MPRRSACGCFAACLVLGAGALDAEVFRNTPSRPLLVMTTHARTDYPVNTLIPPEENLTALFIFADRTLIHSFNHARVFFNEPQISSHVRGRVPIADWNALVSAMVDSRIDTLQSCNVPPIGVPPTQTVGDLVIRWYGRQGRRNTFTISRGGSGPSCDRAAIDLLIAINQTTAKVTAAPTSEYFSVP